MCPGPRLQRTIALLKATLNRVQTLFSVRGTRGIAAFSTRMIFWRDTGNGFHAFRHANATLMNSFGASQKLRQQRLGHAEGSPVTETIYTHVISEDGKRIAAQLGKAIWGVLDPSWTLKENGSGVEAPKPLYLN